MMVPPGLSAPERLGRLDHRQRDAVLDRAAGVGALALDVDAVRDAEQAVDADVRRVADGVQDVLASMVRSLCGLGEVAAIMVRARRQSADARAPAKRHLPARLPAPAHRPHARLADAPGRPLPARVPRHARQGRQLHGPGHQHRLRDRSHAAAAGALSAGRRHPVQRHPDRARRDGPGPELRRSAKARASPRRCATKPPSRSSRCPTWTSCAMCSTPSPRSARR